MEDSIVQEICAALEIHSIPTSIADYLVREFASSNDRTDLVASAAGVLGTVCSDFGRLWDIAESVVDVYLNAAPKSTGCSTEVTASSQLPDNSVQTPEIPDEKPKNPDMWDTNAMFSYSKSTAPPQGARTQESQHQAQASIIPSKAKGRSKGVSLTADLWSGRVALTPHATCHSTDLDGDMGDGEARVCRHFIAGECMRKDCPFSHDLRSIPCKFWASGMVDGFKSNKCTAGNECSFLHAANEPSGPHATVDIRDLCPPNDVAGNSHHECSTDLAVEDASQTDVEWVLDMILTAEDEGVDGFWSAPEETHLPLDDETSFPSLPGAPSGSLSRPPPYTRDISDSLAFRLALSSLARAFPGVSQPELRRVLIENSGNFHRAVSAVHSATGSVPIPGANVSRLEKVRPPMKSGRSVDTTEGRRYESIARAIAGSLPTISTGGSLASVYKDTRSGAEALSRSRNTALARATQAYLTGNGAEAARWSKIGRELDDQMQDAQADAAVQIFASRNQSSGSGASVTVTVSSCGVHDLCVPLVDLHGLHPAEAASAAEAVCRQHTARASASSGDGAWVCLLTGARHHSSKLGKGGGSVHAAVHAQLEEQGWAVYDKLPVPGVLVIRLTH